MFGCLTLFLRISYMSTKCTPFPSKNHTHFPLPIFVFFPLYTPQSSCSIVHTYIFISDWDLGLHKLSYIYSRKLINKYWIISIHQALFCILYYFADDHSMYPYVIKAYLPLVFSAARVLKIRNGKNSGFSYIVIFFGFKLFAYCFDWQSFLVIIF